MLKSGFKRTTLVLAVAITLTAVTFPAEAAGTSVYSSVDYFTWKEFDGNGGRLLKETGPIYTIGMDWKMDMKKGNALNSSVEIFSGDVDYEGGTWGGTPISSITKYRGFEIETKYSQPMDEEQNWRAYFGLGYKKWKRDLVSTSLSMGYLEKWTSLYSKVGFEHETKKAKFDIGLKIPLNNSNRVDLFNATVKPGKNVSVYGEYNIKCNSTTSVGITYDSMRFSASDPVYSDVLGVYILQPKSTADIWGIKVTKQF